MRFNLGECCDGEDLAGVYTYDTYGQTAPQAQSPSGMYTYSDSGLPQSRIIGPVGQIRPVQSPVIPQQLMPSPTTMTMPGMVTTAQVMNGSPQPDLTPRDLLKPLPTIVDNQPTQIAQCNSFSEWVDQNPLLAGGLLLGFAWVMLGKKG